MENKKEKHSWLQEIKKNYVNLILIAGILVMGGFLYEKNRQEKKIQANRPIVKETEKAAETEEISPELVEQVLPSEGVELPVVWGDLGKQLVDNGVIDEKQFVSIYEKQGGLSQEEKELLLGKSDKKIVITEKNAPILLNLLWALGLGNKNEILEKGPMSDPKYGGAGGFASTGGWSISKGDSMDHYSKHSFITLTSEQQKVVEDVSKNIYRPCCNNSTYFPDCNHGMAMLGLLELMAKQGVSEKDMYKVALQVNSYWFGDNYLTIASYFKKSGKSWNEVDPKQALSLEYSSSSGYGKIASKVDPVQRGGGKGCGV